MTLKKHPIRTLTLLLGLGLAGAVAQAQAPAAPPPAWKQGMPAEMATSTLAPLPGKLTATQAGDVPIDRIKLPPGFKVEVWAAAVPGVRAVARGDNGKY